MAKPIRKVPVKQSWINDPINIEINFEAWSVAHDLVFGKMGANVSEEIRNAYAIGYYGSQVENGGHSQLVYNIDVQEIRSPFLTSSFKKGAAMVGAPEFSEVVTDFESWIGSNSQEALDQTGFDDGRAEYLDDLDARFSELTQAFKPKLIEFLANSSDKFERSYLSDCVNRNGNWAGDLQALEWVWWWRSGVMMPVADEDHHDVLASLMSGSH